MTSASSDELAWASERRRALIYRIREGIDHQQQDRRFWGAVRRHLVTYCGPEQSEAQRLLADVDEQLGRMDIGMKFGIEWLGSATDPVVNDEFAAEAIPTEYRPWILTLIEPMAMTLAKVKQWLEQRRREELATRN